MKIFDELCVRVLKEGKHEVPTTSLGQSRTIRNAFYAWRKTQVKLGHVDLLKIKVISEGRALFFTLPSAFGYQNQITQSLKDNAHDSSKA